MSTLAIVRAERRPARSPKSVRSTVTSEDTFTTDSLRNRLPAADQDVARRFPRAVFFVITATTTVWIPLALKRSD